jgi:hypothetical protein
MKTSPELDRALATIAALRDDRAPLKRSDMTVVGELFALRFTEGHGPTKGVELYVEDDGNYFFKVSFSRAWLADLEGVAQAAQEMIDVQD